MPDSTFYAALAGARGNEVDDWANYAHKLEHQVAQLRRVVKNWQDNAIDNTARGAVKDELIAELTGGRKASDVCGGKDKYLARVEQKKVEVRARHGIPEPEPAEVARNSETAPPPALEPHQVDLDPKALKTGLFWVIVFGWAGLMAWAYMHHYF